MNLLIVSEVFYPENFLVNDFAQSMVKRGHHVKVMTRQPSYPAGFVFPGYTNERYSVEKWGEIEIHRFDTIEGYRDSKVKKVENYFHFVKRGKDVISRIVEDVDVIIVSQTGPLSVALPAIYAKKKFGTPVVVWTFDIWPDTVFMYGFPKVFPITTTVDYVIKQVYGNADAIMVSSKRFGDSIHQYFPNAQLTYAPNWMVEVPEKPTSLSFDATKVNFAFTGNISKAQNLENTIKGFAKANIPNAVLNIVGDGSTLAQIKELVEKLNCKNVVFHGRIPYDEVGSVLKASDYLVLPLTPMAGVDKTEPYKLQSYLKSGLPILGIIKGAGRELIEENGLGICCDPIDTDDIANGFRQIMKLTDSDKARISTAASNLMQTRFNKDRILDDIEALAQRYSRA